MWTYLSLSLSRSLLPSESFSLNVWNLEEARDLSSLTPLSTHATPDAHTLALNRQRLYILYSAEHAQSRNAGTQSLHEKKQIYSKFAPKFGNRESTKGGTYPFLQ